MKILGLSPLDKDATASLVEDGRVLFASGEERYSRVKQHAGFPALAIEAALNATGSTAGDIERVVYPFLEAHAEARLMRDALDAEARWLREHPTKDPSASLAVAAARLTPHSAPVDGLDDPDKRMDKGPLKALAYKLLGATPGMSRRVAARHSRQWLAQAVASHQGYERELLAGLRELGLSDKLKRSEHHLSHAANAFHGSGYERALIVTLDGYGSGLAGSISLGENDSIKRLHGLSFPHSLGTFYEMVTASLGYHPDRHAGKIVGLAAYGDPSLLAEAVLDRFEFSSDGDDLRMREAQNPFFSRHLARVFPMIHVAAAWQHVLEIVAGKLVQHWMEKTGTNKLVLSGGVTANVKMNQRLHELPAVEHIFVYPNMGDGGCGTGLAMHESWPGGTGEPFASAYLGPEFSEIELQAALDKAGLKATRPANLAAEVGLRLHKGEVVARFDGRMEYGPRSLGNRSILYHGREPEVNLWLNQRLGRTEFMPFAPVTLWEARHRMYKNMAGAEHAAKFMTVTFDCTDEMKAATPAAVHVDGTARPQLINEELNPGYTAILREYEKLSGLPNLINTSFNMHEEPIVCTPDDAVRAFLQGRLDTLVLGPFLVEHPELG
ncbi:MAG: hypothetical protein DHS20C15_14390 [Planctomycetota bacterium]|nr:MAG: hypothetical protein DHS20C15_14390 [Planctomycetota bacterium]